MHEVTVQIWDDLDFAESKVRNPATTTIQVGLNGKWVQLDLTDANSARVCELLDPLMAAGRTPDSSPGHITRKRGRPAGYTIPPESLRYFKQMRTFARENGIPYITSTGKYYYSKRLRDEFTQHLEAQGDEA